MSGELPEAVLRFEPVTVESGLLDAAKVGRVQRCVVVVHGRDVAELEISNLRYEQDGAVPGQWSVSLFADQEDPLRRTALFGRPEPFVCEPGEHEWEYNPDPKGMTYYCPRCTSESMVER